MGSESLLKVGAIVAAVVVALVIVVSVVDPFGSDSSTDRATTDTEVQDDADQASVDADTPSVDESEPSDDPEPTTEPEPTIEPEAAEEPEPPREPTAEELSSATLLFPWTVSATKTKTITPPPAAIQPMAVGTTYSIALNVEGACNNTTGVCSDISSEPHFPMFSYTATEPIEAQVWSVDGGNWTIGIVGYYLSAEYAGAAKCVYQWLEEWNVTVTDAVLDGEIWYANAFEGTMVRTEQFHAGNSQGDIANYCPAYAASDEWAVSSSRDFAAIPTSG